MAAPATAASLASEDGETGEASVEASGALGAEMDHLDMVLVLMGFAPGRVRAALGALEAAGDAVTLDAALEWLIGEAGEGSVAVGTRALDVTAPLLARLPHDLLVAVLSELEPADVVAVRSTCKCLRQATSSPELWRALAHARRRALCDPSAGEAATPPCRGPSRASELLPASLRGAASIVDVCARLVHWPSAMLLPEPTAPAESSDRGGAPSEGVRIGNDGTAHFARVVDVSNALVARFVRANAAYPAMIDGGGLGPRLGAHADIRVAPPLPFATHASALLGRAALDTWALRLHAYFECEMLGPSVADGHADADAPHAVDTAGGPADGAADGAAGGPMDRMGGPIVGLAQPDFLRVGALPDATVLLYVGARAIVYVDGTGRPKVLDVADAPIRADSTLGCGICYHSATAFFTVDGAKLGAVPIDLSRAWHAVAGAGAAPIALRVNLGGGGAFKYDALGKEEALWRELTTEFSTRALFEEHGLGPDGRGDDAPPQRGWPWSGRSRWSERLDDHLRPWLARLAGQPAAPAVPAAPGGALTRAPVAPATVPLWPSADALGVSDADRSELAAFASRAGLPDAITERLSAIGLSLPLLHALPQHEQTSLIRRAALPVGTRLRITHSLQCELGAYLSHPADAGAACWSPRAPRRVFRFARALPMAVLLSPALPARAAPHTGARTLATLRCGDVVRAVASCDGWVEVSLERGAQRSAWALYDGRRVGQAGRLLRPLLPTDVAVDGQLVGLGRAADGAAAVDNYANKCADGGVDGALEGPRYSTTLVRGQTVRERELHALLDLARLPPDDRPLIAAALMAEGASVPSLARASLDEAGELAKRAGLPLGHRLRLLGAVAAHVHRAARAQRPQGVM